MRTDCRQNKARVFFRIRSPEKSGRCQRRNANLQAGIGLRGRVHLLAKGSTVVNTVDRRTLVLCDTSRQHL